MDDRESVRESRLVRRRYLQLVCVSAILALWWRRDLVAASASGEVLAGVVLAAAAVVLGITLVERRTHVDTWGLPLVTVLFGWTCGLGEWQASPDDAPFIAMRWAAGVALTIAIGRGLSEGTRLSN